MLFVKNMVSFIIPAFNMSDYIDRCLRSICQIEDVNLEVIVIDDGSTDNTIEVVSSFAHIDSRIKIFKQANQGQGVARNLGVSHSSGEYIVFVDADDYLSDNYQVVLKHYLKIDDEFDFVNFRMSFINKGEMKFTLPKFKQIVMTGREIFHKALVDDQIYSSPCNKLYSSQFLKSNKIKFPTCRKNEDILYSRMVAYYAERVMFDDSVLYNAEIRDGSTSRCMSLSSITDTIQVFDELECFLHDEGVYCDYSDSMNLAIKKVYSSLLFLCSIRIASDLEYKNALQTFRASHQYEKFCSTNGFLSLKFKNKLLYIIIRSRVINLCRKMLRPLLARYTY
ncbi:glycosyltransferase family 2 protein [Vibrio parahaemolyticus]|uniref:glycosyltransferase family 2 protein n=1 Tax=Vibrio parahaemolyticus TaxID=670 RepID=UPI001A8EECE5|nr:glycosyltransferase family A protein [Vibrio parahaemolyticus]EJB8540142.1 glycosyltransferase family 2 protein [Vibrio parahaemolyticus]MBO0186761.1 glycosyltransferase family 2 protein [Vibrio parahaemolyticus]MBO0218254.1 glycosyltransferase family 2 protein [Vibrio parahaemolyticus]MBY4624004.1 glycosyltransferase family 2 protein [Vibrio parahaemolyticus]MCR9736831.1 glycosyltransferase family 2 protein [Vibrio parahaemolyticus]